MARGEEGTMLNIELKRVLAPDEVGVKEPCAVCGTRCCCTGTTPAS